MAECLQFLGPRGGMCSFSCLTPFPRRREPRGWREGVGALYERHQPVRASFFRSRVAPNLTPSLRSSASVVLAYLIHRERWRLAHCHAWLKERRPSVALQPGARLLLLPLLRKQRRAARVLRLTLVRSGRGAAGRLRAGCAGRGGCGRAPAHATAQPAAAQRRPLRRAPRRGRPARDARRRGAAAAAAKPGGVREPAFRDQPANQPVQLTGVQLRACGPEGMTLSNTTHHGLALGDKDASHNEAPAV